MNRLVPGVLLAGGWLALLFFGSVTLFWVVVVIAACLALFEYFRMASPDLTVPRLVLAILACLLPVLVAVAGRGDLILAAMIASLLAVVAIALHGYGTIGDVHRFMSCGGFATLYVSLCVAHVVLIRHHPQGPFWLTMLMVIVAGSDTGAYYAGRALGRRKLFPQISPKKTVAGGVGGLLAGIAAAEVLNLLFPVQVNPFVLLVAAALLVSGIGVLIRQKWWVLLVGTVLMTIGSAVEIPIESSAATNALELILLTSIVATIGFQDRREREAQSVEVR